jgi:hypothetical protein
MAIPARTGNPHYGTRLDTRKPAGIIHAVTVLSKSAPVEALGLSTGVHHLKMVVADDTVSFELEEAALLGNEDIRRGTGFVANWGGSARKVVDAEDERLTRINDKHLR